MNLTLDNKAYCELYIALNDLKDAIDEGDVNKASALTDVLIHEVRYANVE